MCNREDRYSVLPNQALQADRDRVRFLGLVSLFVPSGLQFEPLLLALGRFGIAPQTQVKSLEKRWAKHRKQNGLDRNGKPSEGTTKPHSLAVSPRPHWRACCRRPLVTSDGAHDGQEDKAVGGDFTHDAPRRRPR